MRITVCGRTDRGVTRSDNQDCFLVLDLGNPDSALAPQGDGSSPDVGSLEFTLDRRGAVLLVADGMGGRAGGARASSLAIESVRDAMVGDGDGEEADAPTARDFARRLKRSLELANAAIHEGGRQGPHAGMGSTATLAGLLGDSVFVAQVGDSRAYLVRARHVGRLTRDQSLLPDLIDSGVLSEEDARTAAGRNMILQALGPTPSVEPAVTYHPLRRGDVLLLCSDGLSGVVDDDEIQSAVSEATDCASLCSSLVDLANERGGPDNITVVAAKVEGDGLDEASDAEGIARREFDAST
ncbi:MAG: protein phosphatase 2C domain-containing protein [Longimicrobiales bacterium]|nr:protein phosphatase 2C domain-containing protein [Longimicrobiales bacterium]